MRLRAFASMLAVAGIAALLAGPARAQHHDDHGGGWHGDHHGGDGHGGDWHGGDGHGGGWHGGGWHGGWHGQPYFGAYDINRWHGGGWRHVWHNGRMGWWWVVGPSWYYYAAPVYPYPSPYLPPSIPAPVGPMWYYCGAPAGYYPYVGQCRVPWQAVPPR